MDEQRLIAVDVEPITITYEGMDADSGGIDMLLLAKSLDGYARILATTSTFAATLTYTRHMDSMPIRVRVQVIRPGSFELQVFLDFVRQSGMLTNFKELLKAVLEWVTAKLAKRPEEDKMFELAKEQLKVIGATNEGLLALMAKMADGLAASARNAAAPIGETCNSTRLALGGEEVSTWRNEDKKAIMAHVNSTIEPTSAFRVFISELDVATGSAKVSFNEQDEHRIRAKITDPVVFQAENPYARALTSKNPLQVTAKAEIVEGEIALLHISDSRNE